MNDRPNVLLICVDHWSGLLTRPAGHPVVMPPTLGQLAQNGVHYSNSYCANAACIPARRSLMPGLTSRTHGDRIFSDIPMPAAPTLAQCFRDAGYQAYGVGKLHVFPQRDRIGFDDVILNEEGRRHPPGGADDYEQFLVEQGFAGLEHAGGLCTNDYLTCTWHLPEHCHPTNWAVREMCRTIHRRDPSRPAFWYLSFIGVHPPVWPPKSYMDLYRDVPIDPPVYGDWSTSFDALPYGAKAYNDRFSIRQAPAHEMELGRRAYYATITHVDHQIRIVIGTLREAGLLDNTIIALTTDHGEMLGDHHLWAKGVMHQKSARIPLIIVPTANDTRLLHDTTDNRLVKLRDIMPTLLDLAGIDIPDTVEGMSLLSERRREYLYGEYREGADATRMVRDARYKLIYYAGGNFFQLFDLEEDPLEQRNLAITCGNTSGNPAHTDVQQRLTNVLIDHLYDSNPDWLKDGQLVGVPVGPYVRHPNRGLSGQRGLRLI